MAELIGKEYRRFEDIKHVRDDGSEFWSARELGPVLDYVKWDNFHKVIKRAMIACENAGRSILDQFPEVGKLVEGGVAPREKVDYELTRYACYLIVQNGDPRKEVIALGQTYFAIQTYRQEVADHYNQLDEDRRRLVVRGDIKQWNQLLAETAHDAGVITNEEFAIFQNAGYMGLYGGLDVDDLTHVINYAMPDDIASYTHRSGRTGRAGKKGTSIAIIHTREKHKIRAVEKQIGKEFVDGTLPTPQEICTKQLFRAIDEIEKVDVIEEQIEPFMAEVRRHFEYVDKEDILKKMVSREFGRFLSYYANAPEIEKPVSKKERERGDSRNSRGSRSSREPREPRAVQEGYTRLFINLGKDHGFYPGEVMQFVNRHVQGRQEVGHIELMSGFSFIEVPNRDAKKVMSALDGTFYKGRQVRCNEDRPDGKPAAGGRGKGRKGETEGRGRSGRGRKEETDFSRFEKKSKRNSPRKDFDSDVAGMPETGDWRQFFKKNDDQSRRRGKKSLQEPDFSEEGWARRKPKKK